MNTVPHTPGPYKHKEAFCLMWYECEETSCMHRERIWNSRDGVTPFGLSCPSCGRTSLLHADWAKDQRVVGHKLHRHQRYFRDGTADEAVKIIERRIANFETLVHAPPESVKQMLLEQARNQTDEWLPGWPILTNAPLDA